MIAKQHVFGLVALALITGAILGGHIATIQGETRCRESLIQFLIEQNYGWYDPATGKLVLLDVKPLQFVPMTNETKDN